MESSQLLGIQIPRIPVKVVHFVRKTIPNWHGHYLSVVGDDLLWQ